MQVEKGVPVASALAGEAALPGGGAAPAGGKKQKVRSQHIAACTVPTGGKKQEVCDMRSVAGRAASGCRVGNPPAADAAASLQRKREGGTPGKPPA